MKNLVRPAEILLACTLLFLLLVARGESWERDCIHDGGTVAFWNEVPVDQLGSSIKKQYCLKDNEVTGAL